MNKALIALILFIFFTAAPAFSATVTCEIEEIRGNSIVLKNCDERAKGFVKGNKVKVKLQKKGKK